MLKSINNTQKIKYFIITFITIIVILLAILLIKHSQLYKVDKNYSKINLNNINKLMIIAHPDDELIWGGGHLIEDDYLVVCITCGDSKVRVKEFVKVMNKTKDKYIMLGYPDKNNGERANWEEELDSLSNDIKEIISLKEWNLIITHNPEGEYNHIHHQLINKIVTELVTDKEKLYYFDKYYSKKEIINYYDEKIPLKDKVQKTKKKLLTFYESQKYIQTSFEHIYDYENWQSYKEWMNNYEKTK